MQNKAKANVVGKGSGNTPLLLAAADGNKDLITKLIDAGAEINIATKSGWMALHAAAEKFTYRGGDYDNIKLLLRHGATSTKDFLGKTPADIVSDGKDESLAEIFDQETTSLGDSN